ncbi:MAG: methyltransferase domain-containing protein [Cyclobacteriaceae bacterium]
MGVGYDKYYQTENLFGEAYPELIQFFYDYPTRGKLLDLGCGQGRDAIPLARLGYEVTGVDHSEVGIGQMMRAAEKDSLSLSGRVEDIYEFNDLSRFNFVLLDSMFHFTKADRAKEADLVKRLVERVDVGTLLVFCIQNTGNKVKMLQEAIDLGGSLEKIVEKDFKYAFEDKESRHKSVTNYKMIAVRN